MYDAPLTSTHLTSAVCPSSHSTILLEHAPKPCLFPRLSTMDYSKWEVLAAEEDRDEQRRKAEQRQKNKEDYYRQQQERIQQHQQQQPAATAVHAQHDPPHHHEHHDHHDHDHNHTHSHDQPSSSTVPAYRRTCGCGFTDVDTLLAMQKHAAANPGPSAEEKRQKQLNAISAVRTHAKELYGAQQFQQAYSVYERGALIIAGMIDLPPDAQQLVDQHELAITHNMALCQLQQHNYTHAIELARMALQLTSEQDSDEATKAHYRLLQCYVRLGRWGEAETEVAELNKRGGWKGLDEEVRLMRRMKEAEKAKEREFHARMREKMRAEQEKEKQRQEMRMEEAKDGPATDTR